jgi:poly(A) polymerase
MQPADKIEPQAWMAAPETTQTMMALMSEGDIARFVGGAVRDTLLGRAISDVDIASTGDAERNITRLEAAGIKAIPTGLKHGTITAVIGARHFEVTTLRHDLETDGRHAVVSATDDWLIDAARRDFTMNALYLDPDGTLYDPTGGQMDIRRGLVRFVGDPGARIQEDYLRILRFFRFHAWYGTGPCDPAGLAACRENRDGIGKLSRERIRIELLKLLTADDPTIAVNIMRENGIWTPVLGCQPEPEKLARLMALEKNFGSGDPIRRLAALAGNVGAAELADRLRLSRAETRRLNVILDPAQELVGEPTATDINRALYRHGKQAVLDWAMVTNSLSHATAIKNVNLKPFPLSGKDAIAQGLPAGPKLGEWLAKVENWWLAEGFAPDRAACQAKLKELLARED